MRIRSAAFVKTKPFLYEMRISSSDYFGEWQGFGQFLQTADGPLFWMLKYYDDAQRARQTGQW